MSIEELLMELRSLGYFSLDNIQYATLETDGNLCVVPYPDYKSTPQKPFHHLPINLIIDGKIIDDGLTLAKKDISWLDEHLKNRGYLDTNNILICILDQYDNIIIQPKTQ